MICKPCAFEADNPDLDAIPDFFEERGHAACNGCDCQHKPVKEGLIFEPS